MLGDAFQLLGSKTLNPNSSMHSVRHVIDTVWLLDEDRKDRVMGPLDDSALAETLDDVMHEFLAPESCPRVGKRNSQLPPREVLILCEVEALQLSSIDRLERALALALFMVVAWRITYLMRKGRTCPDLDARLFFDPNEIRGAHLLTKKKMPAKPPTLNEVVRLIAQVRLG
jgi:hypothetical protein